MTATQVGVKLGNTFNLRPGFVVHLRFCRQSATIVGEQHMLETIAILLIIGWVLGLVSSYTLGGFIHLLLVVAIVMIVLRVIQGRRPL
jgi:hypothetical protein